MVTLKKEAICSSIFIQITASILLYGSECYYLSSASILEVVNYASTFSLYPIGIEVFPIFFVLFEE